MDDMMPVAPEWVLVLPKPVAYSGGHVTELTLREPTMGELNKALADLGPVPSQHSQNRMQITLVTLVSGVPRPVIESLPWPIVVGAADWLMSFTAAAPATPPGSERS